MNDTVADFLELFHLDEIMIASAMLVCRDLTERQLSYDVQIGDVVSITFDLNNVNLNPDRDLYMMITKDSALLLLNEVQFSDIFIIELQEPDFHKKLVLTFLHLHGMSPASFRNVVDDVRLNRSKFTRRKHGGPV